MILTVTGQVVGIIMTLFRAPTTLTVNGMTTVLVWSRVAGALVLTNQRVKVMAALGVAAAGVKTQAAGTTALCWNVSSGQVVSGMMNGIIAKRSSVIVSTAKRLVSSTQQILIVSGTA
jgi:uncharacterized protein (UPF0371 family)